ncbi:MAG: hypothetical protein R3C11_04735 [Planctomycetaceae bacterium]
MLLKTSVSILYILMLLGTLWNLGCLDYCSKRQQQHTHSHHYKAPTLAQELSELKKVRMEGALSEKEYTLARQRLINEYSADDKGIAMETREDSY